MDQSIKKDAQIIWDYMHLHHELQKADVVLVLGTEDFSIAHKAAEIFHAKLAPLIVCSGKSGTKPSRVLPKTEAELLADVLLGDGVPEEVILLEKEATNTEENITFTEKMLQEQDRDFHNIIIVCKPYVERRGYATAKVHWPDKKIMMASPDISFEDYLEMTPNREHLINLMVGDLQRIRKYPKLGFQIEQEIPESVWGAYERLVELGFDKFLIRE